MPFYFSFGSTASDQPQAGIVRTAPESGGVAVAAGWRSGPFVALSQPQETMYRSILSCQRDVPKSRQLAAARGAVGRQASEHRVGEGSSGDAARGCADARVAGVAVRIGGTDDCAINSTGSRAVSVNPLFLVPGTRTRQGLRVRSFRNIPGLLRILGKQEVLIPALFIWSIALLTPVINIY
jgi:hypothetical protein